MGLEDPAARQQVGEYSAAPSSAPVSVFAPQGPPNPMLQLSNGEPATARKIRGMVNELLAGNMQNADAALKSLFVANPKVALEIYTELMQFSMPKLKAVAVAIDDRSDNPKTMDFAALVKAMQGDE